MTISKLQTCLFIAAFTSLTSCQSGDKKTTIDPVTGAVVPVTTTTSNSTADYHQIIKTDKKKQSDLDLPFRGFELEKSITTIATGSGADQDQPQPIWKTIEKNSPDLFIFTGDTLSISKPEQKPISQQYRKIKLIPEYRSIREKVPFMAIWDDNDFGALDGGTDNPDKDAARAEFVKHWSYLKSTLPSSQKALYHSKIFGSKKQKVQVIMLDTRWDRSDLKKNTEDTFDPKSNDPKQVQKPIIADTEKGKHFLSSDQWNWLEHELKKPAEFRILVSPIQVIADDHNFEKWGNFPNEREKLFVMLQKSKVKNLVIVSGDRYFGALAQIDIKKYGPVFELTSSGLNKPSPAGNMLTDKTYLADGYIAPNFGLIRIDWQKRVATLQIKSLTDEVKSSAEVRF